MADMFGAPMGIGAAEADVRQNVQGALLAQKTLGEIAAQPADLELKQAHARLYGAEADLKAAEVANQKAMAELALRARTQGRTATTDDLGADGKPKSLAAPLERLFNFAEAEGTNPMLTAGIAKKIAEIKQKEASAASSAETQQLNALKGQRERMEMRGSFAAAALQAGPNGYAQVLQAAISRLPPDQAQELAKLPQTFAAAQPLLKAAVTESMQALDKVKLDEKAIQDKAQRARWDSANAASNQAVKTGQARESLIKERTEVLKKNGGEGTGASKEAREELTLSRRALRLARERKEFPPAPLDPGQRELNKTYTAADGSRFLWTQNPATGKGAALLLTPAPGTKAATAAAASEPSGRRTGAQMEESDDDVSAEDEE